MRANDADALEVLLADQLRYVYSTGKVEGKAQVVDALRSGGGRYGPDLDIRDVEIRAFDDNAVLLGIFEIHVKGADSDFRGRNRFTMHWTREGSEWKLSSWQSTAIPDD